nr:myb-like protein X [Procambarus clarkii]
MMQQPDNQQKTSRSAVNVYGPVNKPPIFCTRIEERWERMWQRGRPRIEDTSSISVRASSSICLNQSEGLKLEKDYHMRKQEQEKREAVRKSAEKKPGKKAWKRAGKKSDGKKDEKNVEKEHREVGEEEDGDKGGEVKIERIWKVGKQVNKKVLKKTGKMVEKNDGKKDENKTEKERGQV